MKKKLIILALFLIFTLLVTGCETSARLTSETYQVFDTVYDYNYAYVLLPNGEEVEGPIEHWRDFTDGDQIEVEFKNGDTYLGHSSVIILRRTK